MRWIISSVLSGLMFIGGIITTINEYRISGKVNLASAFATVFMLTLCLISFKKYKNSKSGATERKEVERRKKVEEKCCICNVEEGKKKIASGAVCKQCLHLCSIKFQVSVNKNTTKEVILAEIEDNNNNKKLLDNFTATKKIGNYVEFDEQNRLWLVPDGLRGTKINPKVYSFDDVLEYELLEDGDSVTKGGLGRAVAGGMLLGGVGAVVGGVTGKKKTKSVINSLRIKITVNEINNPSVYIDLIERTTKANSVVYKSAYSSAQEILSTMSVIGQKVDNQRENNQVSATDELIKLKDLLDQGILTEEEFSAKKTELLSRI